MWININDKVRVKLTPIGRSLLATDYPSPASPPPEPDSEGYTTFQIHRLMTLFGGSVEPGMALPFEPRVEVLTAPPPKEGYDPAWTLPPYDNPDKRPLLPCVSCGSPTRGRIWDKPHCLACRARLGT